MAGAIPAAHDEAQESASKEAKVLNPEEEKKREAEKLLQQRFKTFDLYCKEINSLMELWDRTQGCIFRQPSPSEKSEHDDHLANRKLKKDTKENKKAIDSIVSKKEKDKSQAEAEKSKTDQQQSNDTTNTDVNLNLIKLSKWICVHCKLALCRLFCLSLFLKIICK